MTVPTNHPSLPLAFQSHPQAWLHALWKFSRPHTIIGTSLSVFSLYFIALAESKNLPPQVAPSPQLILPALLACLWGNLYIVGLNQLTDINIDRINKPRLPLASGEFTPKQGTRIVMLSGVLSIIIAASQGVWLLAVVTASLMIGSAYSLPPLRLKRSPFWASMCILGVRGGIVNLGLFLHFTQDWAYISFPASVLLLTAFILSFTFTIAIFKDMPDVEGDRQYSINTFTIRLGASTVFNLGRWILTATYMGMVITGLIVPIANPWILSTVHIGIAGFMWFFSFQVDLTNQASISYFYQMIWKLFFLEYLIYPLILSISHPL